MPLIPLFAGTPSEPVPEVAMGETYRLEAEEESSEDVHKMRDELELQLISSGKEARPRLDPPPRQSARLNLAWKPAIQRSRRT